ncbi:kinase-like domain-containing protein [Sporodiniella umbellata]|nr:kinase-like domain-containing protein [Sporodiniella umbellata]
MNYYSKKPTQVVCQLFRKAIFHKKRQARSSCLNQYGTVKKTVAGIGASAMVKLIQKDSKSPLYAVKIFQKKKKGDAQWIKKIMSEYCISSVLKHPNIINTFDLVLDSEFRYCIIMEYCSGGDLYSWIKEDKLDLKISKDLFRQLIKGMSYLHGLGIAHRDIKPENLLIETKSRLELKITDFGEADVFRQVLCSQGKLSNGTCGSVPYIAPEVFLSASYDASKSDVWSAAIVYSCMILKGLPFLAAIDLDSNYRLFCNTFKREEFPVFRSLDKDSQRILYYMMHPDPEKRQSVNKVLKVLSV